MYLCGCNRDANEGRSFIFEIIQVGICVKGKGDTHYSSYAIKIKGRTKTKKVQYEISILICICSSQKRKKKPKIV